MKEKIILRSLLFVPGDKEKLIFSASQKNADAIIFDLEDSIIPANKQIARDLINQHIGLFEKFHKFVRINELESGFQEKDISAMMQKQIDGFVIPKSYSKKDIVKVDNLLTKYEKQKGFKIGKFAIIPLIETAAAVLNALEICTVTSRVIGIAFGCEDFITDLHGINDKNRESLLIPRALIALAARAVGVIPIDTTHIDVHDLDDLEKNLIFVKKLGFEGMLCLHPKEIELVHAAFSPSQEEITNSKKIIYLSELAKKKEELLRL
jgi:citrate lyase subunit beta / citryl-CoA lyase